LSGTRTTIRSSSTYADTVRRRRRERGPGGGEHQPDRPPAGDRSTGGTKPATLETGATINVPLFITTGEKIKVDTRDGRYLGRS